MEDEGRGWEEKLFRRNFAEFRLLGELRLRYDRVFPISFRNISPLRCVTDGERVDLPLLERV